MPQERERERERERAAAVDIETNPINPVDIGRRSGYGMAPCGVLHNDRETAVTSALAAAESAACSPPSNLLIAVHA